MMFEALATDYDGTLARDGAVDEPTLDALARARQGGLRLIMVTGRQLSDLFNTFPHAALFDRIVAENGAVLFDPGKQAVDVLASPPPPALLERLAGENVPLSVGHSVVATIESHEHQVLAAIHDLGLDWHVTYNKGSVMALPAGITKASGLAPALAALGVSHQRTIGVGDAENDLAFLRVCGMAVAVSNALQSVKDMADVVTASARGAGVAELIDRLIRGGLKDLAEASPLDAPNRSD